MDGLTLHMDKTIINMPVSASVIRMDYFRPSWMKRSNTDMGMSKKRNEKMDLTHVTDARQNSSRANPMPVVSVQYDVPKTPPSPLMYRFRRLHTPLSSQGQRTRSEERVNQIINVESHRLKGLGVGKCYSEYIPPPTAPEPVRLGAGTTPSTTGLSNSRNTLRQSILPSPMSNSQSATPTRHQADADRSVKSSQSSAISQLTKIYTARQKHSNKEKAKDVLENKILTAQTQRNQFHHPAYLQSPVLFSQSYHDSRNHGNHSNKDQGQGRHEVKDKCHMEEDEDKEEEEVEDKNDYSSYQNVKNGYHLNHGEYNNWTIKRMERKSKTCIVPSSTGITVDVQAPFVPSPPATDGKPPPARPTRAMSCLDLTLQCVVLQDKVGNNGPPGTNTSSTAMLNMNQRLNQMKAQKELTSVQMYSQRMVRLRMTQNQRRQVLPWFGSTVVVPQGLGSSSTPTVPYSTADILYGNEVNGTRGMSSDEARQNSFGESEKSKDMTRQRSKELELHPNNRRPSSKSGRQKSISIDSVTPFDKDGIDTLKNLSSALPPTKPTHHFRPNGIRSSMVKNESLYTSSSKTNGANSGREQDDLVAMGTLWSPNNSDKPPQVGSSSGALSSQQVPPGVSSRINSTSNTNTNSYPSKVVSSSSVNNSMSSSNNTLNTQRKYPGNSVRPIVVQNNVSGKKNSNSMREQEDPKYTDPLIGAPASFQQRIIELGALEGDTVRWERTKRLKKKKQDRDS